MRFDCSESLPHLQLVSKSLNLWINENIKKKYFNIVLDFVICTRMFRFSNGHIIIIELDWLESLWLFIFLSIQYFTSAHLWDEPVVYQLPTELRKSWNIIAID